MAKDMDMDGEEKPEGDMEDRVVDLEDALDELKAEFEAMMADKKDGDDEEKEEAVDMPLETPAEMPVESKEATKETVKEYKIQKSADNADHADSKSSPVNSKVKSMGGGTHNIAKGGAEDKGRPAPTAQKMSDFENSPAKDKSTSFKKNEKADTADHSDKSAKSPVNAKA